jgi:hypothetical protein
MKTRESNHKNKAGGKKNTRHKILNLDGWMVEMVSDIPQSCDPINEKSDMKQTVSPLT